MGRRSGLRFNGLDIARVGFDLDILRFLLRFQDVDDVRLHDIGSTKLQLRIVRKHDPDLDPEDTLLELDVSGRSVHVVCRGITGSDHVSILELHRLRTLSPEFTRDDEFTTLRTVLHDVLQDTVAGTTDCETTQELVTDGLGLSDRTESTVLDTVCVQDHVPLREIETLLDEAGEFPDPTMTFTDDLLSLGRTDDDFSPNCSTDDLDTGVSVCVRVRVGWRRAQW